MCGMVRAINGIYQKVQVDPKIEAKMIGVLRKTGLPFKSVSRTDYYISKTQCQTLTKAGISYKKL